MNMQRPLINLMFIVGLFFMLAFACEDDKGDGGSAPTKHLDDKSATQTEGEDEQTADETEVQSDRVPRLGKYTIMAYGNPRFPPSYLGHFELLSGGRYRPYLFGGELSGEGKYSFDPATGRVEFLSGKFKDDGWGGGFEISREGKTHTITLYGKGTIGTNSTDNP